MKSTFIYINFILLGLVGIISCQDDDRFQGVATTRDVQTQADLDNQKIRALLTNYTFNDKEFEISNGIDNVRDNNYTHKNIEFIRINDDNGDEIPLSLEDQEISSGTPIINSSFLDSIPNIMFANVSHTAYVLKLREGEGKPVTIADPVLTTFKGELFGNTAESFEVNEVAIGDFFEEQNAPVWSREINSNIGFSSVAAEFKTAIPVANEAFDEIENNTQLLLKQCQVFETNTDASMSFSNNSYGIGVAFIPSGIGFNTLRVSNTNGSDIDQYQNLIYSFTLFNTEYTDQDNDGIPSLLEMTAPDGSIDSTIDTDNDGIPDFNDSDDDGDETATLQEVKIVDSFPDIDSNCDGIFTNDDDVEFLDTNENGVPDHLDNTIRVGF